MQKPLSILLSFLVTAGLFFTLSSSASADISLFNMEAFIKSFQSLNIQLPTQPTLPSNATTFPLPTATQNSNANSSPTPIKSEPTSTRAPSPTPTRTQIQTTSIVTPTSTPIKSGPTPSTANGVTLNTKQTYIMNAINDYRRSKGMYAVKPDRYTCDFAKIRAKEIATTGFDHSGFQNRISNRTLPYPSYHLVTENLAMTSNYQNVVNMWINSPGHAVNMQKDTPYICVADYSNYYAYEGWRP